MMSGLLKSTVLGTVLLTGVALAVQAQSISASPSRCGVQPQTVPKNAFGPKVSGTHQWKYQHYAPPADYGTKAALHPYSEPGRIGPKPN